MEPKTPIHRFRLLVGVRVNKARQRTNNRACVNQVFDSHRQGGPKSLLSGVSSTPVHGGYMTMPAKSASNAVDLVNNLDQNLAEIKVLVKALACIQNPMNGTFFIPEEISCLEALINKRVTLARELAELLYGIHSRLNLPMQ